MTPIDRHRKMTDLFDRAMELPPDQREVFVRAECGQDQGLLQSMLKLLAAEGQSTVNVGAAVGAAAATVVGRLAEGPGSRIGPYKLLEQIGEGGFGVVFMAEQQEPMVRRVALKIIKLGMDTQQVIARFEAERQALAMMDHPNIATVLDAGATDTGRPYFVMELVRGDPITEYCDKNHLDTDERLALFMDVCHAVQHAHQKGIIHRDIKPSNVLVTMFDGRPIPKVIDFGIAKAMHQRLTDKTLFTAHRHLIGTPQYMSPEQAEMSGVDIDTRSDLYSLGVLLYELLTGTTPFDPEALRKAALGEIQRIIREEEPLKPSTRLSTLGTLPSVAANRRTEPARLSAVVRGDLDWIVMKCLEKDRTRRYETANGLAVEIQRHLTGEPVMAAPPSRMYRARKFVRRNKGPVAAAAFVAAALVLGMAGTTAGLVYAGQQRDKAIAERKAADTAREAAVASQHHEAQQRKKAETVMNFMRSTFQSSDPFEGGSQGMLVADAMMNGVPPLDDGLFKDDPEVEADLRYTIAFILKNNARPYEALDQAEKSLKIYRQLRPGDDLDLIQGEVEVGVCLEKLGRFADAMTRHQAALEMGQRLFKSDNVELVGALRGIGACLINLGKPEEALPNYKAALDMCRRLFTGDDPHIPAALNNFAQCLCFLGRFEEALPMYQEVLADTRRLERGDTPNLAAATINLATCIQGLGRPSEALSLFEEGLQMRRRLFKGDHPDVAIALERLGTCLLCLNRFDQALASYQECAAIEKRLYQADHLSIGRSLVQVAEVSLELSDPVTAISQYREALDISRRNFPNDHPEVVSNSVGLGQGLTEAAWLQRSDPAANEEAIATVAEAESLLRWCVAIRTKTMPGTERFFNTESLLGGALVCSACINSRTVSADRVRMLQEAEPLLVEGFERMSSVSGESNECVRNRRLRHASDRLVRLYTFWDELEPGKGHEIKAEYWRGRLSEFAGQ